MLNEYQYIGRIDCSVTVCIAQNDASRFAARTAYRADRAVVIHRAECIP